MHLTTSDQYKISLFLKKLIEYFFGEDFGGKEIQDMVSLFRIQSTENRKANIEYIQKTIKLQILGKDIANLSNKDITPEQM